MVDIIKKIIDDYKIAKQKDKNGANLSHLISLDRVFLETDYSDIAEMEREFEKTPEIAKIYRRLKTLYMAEIIKDKEYSNNIRDGAIAELKMFNSNSTLARTIIVVPSDKEIDKRLDDILVKRRKNRAYILKEEEDFEQSL